jgi:hypothetical protein
MLNLSLSVSDAARTLKAEAQTPALLLKGKDRRLAACYSASIGSLAREGQMSICLRRREFIAAWWPPARKGRALVCRRTTRPALRRRRRA